MAPAFRVVAMAALFVAVSGLDPVRLIVPSNSSEHAYLSLNVRGADYIRLNGSQGTAGHTMPVYHSTFSPRLANKTHDTLALRSMSSLGYNAARVFIDVGSAERDDGVGGAFNSSSPLSIAYMTNLATFIRTASSLNIYTMITLPPHPDTRLWLTKCLPSDPNLAPPNAYYLHEPTVKARVDFATVFMKTLMELLGGDVTGILAVSLSNEMALWDNATPFSSMSGNISTADGHSYDMASAASRQAAADSNTLFTVNQMTAAIKTVSPHTLVTMGMFTFQAVGKTGPDGLMEPGSHDHRYPSRPSLLSKYSQLDYIDVHVYPQGDLSTWSLSKDLASSEWSSIDFHRRPIVGCEFGAFHKFFTTIEDAVQNMVATRDGLLAAGFAGWMFWTWDTYEQPRLWYLAEDNNTLAKALMS